MIRFVVFFILFLAGSLSFATQKAKIVGDAVEVYAEADFDSEVIDEVYKNQTYIISNKLYGPFYRIKLKSGKVGYIVDYELNIEGKGQLKPRDLDELEMKDAMGVLDRQPEHDPQQEAEENEFFGKGYQGVVLQMMNYHEDTMGSTQVDDLLLIGYKSTATTTWSVAGTWQVPKYYTQRPGYSASGGKLWADVGFSHSFAQFPGGELKFGAGVFSHLSLVKLTAPTRNYDLQDVTAGVNAEVSFLKKIKSVNLDFSIKYYIDKARYASLGLGFLF